jgi:inner membrane protein
MRLASKILTVFGLTVALLIPLTMIRGTVQDRQRYRAEAVAEVAQHGRCAAAGGPGPVRAV